MCHECGRRGWGLVVCPGCSRCLECCTCFGAELPDQLMDCDRFDLDDAEDNDQPYFWNR